MTPLRVQYIQGAKGISSSNILWAKHHPKRGGEFPANHPCASNPKPMVSGAHRTRAPGETEWTEVPGESPVSDDPLGKFRARGYWASCFPEGDGITFIEPDGQKYAQTKKDIEECFGWEVTAGPL